MSLQFKYVTVHACWLITNMFILFGCSMETALLLIKNGVHLSLARGEPTALVLFDLSASFDTIDHNILLGYLKSWFGLGGTALRWFASYLRNHCQAFRIGSTRFCFGSVAVFTLYNTT